MLYFARLEIYALPDSCDCLWSCARNARLTWVYPNCNGNTIPDILTETLINVPNVQAYISTCPYGTNCVGILLGTDNNGITQDCIVDSVGTPNNCWATNTAGGSLPVPITTGFIPTADGRISCPGCVGMVCALPTGSQKPLFTYPFSNVGAIPWKFNASCPGQCPTIDGCNVDIESINILSS